MKKKILAIVLVLFVLFAFFACMGGDGEELESVDTSYDTNKTTTSFDAEDGSWAIYWYLCGSDLESGGGFATNDLSELL